MSDTSLRERSKVRRRDAIERAAMRLFATKGYDGATITEIAEEAQVAPRTVSLYFPSKPDLVLAHVNDACERLTVALAERATGEPLVDVFGRWLRDEQERTDPEMRALRAAMFQANPALRALRSVQVDEALRAATRALAEQLGLPEDHFAVRIARAAACGVLDEYASIAAASDDAQAAHDAALTFLAAGVKALGVVTH